MTNTKNSSKYMILFIMSLVASCETTGHNFVVRNRSEGIIQVKIYTEGWPDPGRTLQINGDIKPGEYVGWKTITDYSVLVVEIICNGVISSSLRLVRPDEDEIPTELILINTCLNGEK